MVTSNPLEETGETKKPEVLVKAMWSNQRSVAISDVKVQTVQQVRDIQMHSARNVSNSEATKEVYKATMKPKCIKICEMEKDTDHRVLLRNISRRRLLITSVVTTGYHFATGCCLFITRPYFGGYSQWTSSTCLYIISRKISILPSDV